MASSAIASPMEELAQLQVAESELDIQPVGPVCFVDVETTGLDPDRHEIWEVALLVRDDARPGTPAGQWSGCAWQLAVDLGRADPKALEVGRFHERYDSTRVSSPWAFAREFASLTRGLHLAGAVVSFDEERLRRLLRAHNACPQWNYHLVDVEALAAGAIAEPPPWDSNDLSRKLGVDPEQFDRHTAMGDARWAKAIYDAAMRREVA